MHSKPHPSSEFWVLLVMSRTTSRRILAARTSVIVAYNGIVLLHVQ